MPISIDTPRGQVVVEPKSTDDALRFGATDDEQAKRLKLMYEAAEAALEDDFAKGLTTREYLTYMLTTVPNTLPGETFSYDNPPSVAEQERALALMRVTAWTTDTGACFDFNAWRDGKQYVLGVYVTLDGTVQSLSMES